MLIHNQYYTQNLIFVNNILNIFNNIIENIYIYFNFMILVEGIYRL